MLRALFIGVIFAGRLCSAETPAFDERQSLAKLQAMDLFPDLEREDSELAVQVAAEVKQLEVDQPAFFDEPAWPLRVARRVAGRLNIKPRTVAEIRAGIAESFEVDPEEIQRIHGIRLISARVSVGGEWLDVTPQIGARISRDGLVVDYDRLFAATLGDVSQFQRKRDEGDEDYWKRQRALVAAAAEAGQGRSSLQVTYEFQSERSTATAKDGERLTISEEGKVSTAKIAPETGTRKVATASVKAAKPGGKSSDASGASNNRMPRAPEKPR